MIFSAAGRQDTASFTTAARFGGGVVPEKPVRASAVLVGGPHTAQSAGEVNVRDKVVLIRAAGQSQIPRTSSRSCESFFWGVPRR